MVVDVIELNKTTAYKKGVKIGFESKGDIPDLVKGDEVRVKKILTNLIGNAVKFTLRGHVKVVINVLSNNGTHAVLQFQIHDTGVGINSGKRRGINELLASAVSGPTSGDAWQRIHGFGLRFTKLFLEDLHGSIELESREGEGTSVFVALPFDIPSDDERRQEEGAGVICAASLYAEDTLGEIELIETLLISSEPLARMAMKSRLETIYCSVSTVEGVTQAKAILEELKFDAIISDVKLIDGAGFDVVAYLQDNQDSLNYNTPIFGLAAQGTVDEDDALRAGFVGVFPKPLVVKKFQTLLFAHIRGTTIL